MDGHYTTSQAARHLGISRQRFHQLIRQFRIIPKPHPDCDRTWIITFAEFDRLAIRDTMPGPKPKKENGK